DRSVAPMCFRTVGSALPVKILFLHYALETFALRTTDHVDEIARLKLCDAEIHFAFRGIRFQTKLAHKSLRLRVRFFEIAKLGFANPRLFLRSEPDLDRRIAIVLVR